MPADEFQRRSTDRGEPTNADLRTYFDQRFNEVRDEVLKEVHVLEHDFRQHLVEAAVRERRVAVIENEDVPLVQSLNEWRSEVRGAFSALRWQILVLGALGTAATVLSFLAVIGK